MKNGSLRYFFFEAAPGVHPATVRRIAVNVAKLPELLSRHRTWGLR